MGIINNYHVSKEITTAKKQYREKMGWIITIQEPNNNYSSSYTFHFAYK